MLARDAGVESNLLKGPCHDRRAGDFDVFPNEHINGASVQGFYQPPVLDKASGEIMRPL